MYVHLTGLHHCHHSHPESLFSLRSTPVHCKEVDSNGAFLEYKQLGCSISVPPGAVEHPVTISASCSFREELCPPNGYEFVSPVYLLDVQPDVRFLKKVTLHLHHWAKSSVSSLSFGFCQLPTNTAYKFQVEEGGIFVSRKQYGTIVVNHFSLGVIMRLRKMVQRISRVFANQGNFEYVFFKVF